MLGHEPRKYHLRAARFLMEDFHGEFLHSELRTNRLAAIKCYFFKKILMTMTSA
jgi:hypothetical protein